MTTTTMATHWALTKAIAALLIRLDCVTTSESRQPVLGEEDEGVCNEFGSGFVWY